jgi:hypothetical protein
VARADEPAFPIHPDDLKPTGLTVREWYAGQALAGVILAAELCYAFGKRAEASDADEYAHDAFLIADAMLAQSAKKQPTGMNHDRSSPPQAR